MFAHYFSKPFFTALLFLGALAAIIGLAVDLALMPYLAGRFKGTVKVPSLEGLATDKVKVALNAKSLLYMPDSSEFSGDVPAGRVLSQYPEPGTEVKKGRRVWVRISKGARRLEVPPLRGLSPRQAEITLQQLGFRVGRSYSVSHPSVPPGAVVGTVPPARSALAKGGRVDIQVSAEKGSASVMPSVIGLSLGQARSQLARSGLDLSKVEYQKDAQSLPNTVLSQQPEAGDPVEGRPVHLTVSQ